MTFHRIALLTACLALASACHPDAIPYSDMVLSSHGPDAYTYDGNATTVDVSATAPVTDQRSVFWRTGAPATLDQEACATWVGADEGNEQQGIALRIRPDGHAITVTKNVFLGAHWILNFHEWPNTSGNPFGAVNLEPLLRDQPFPWRVCMRATGNVAEVKVWLPGQPEPAYGDPTHGGSALIPDGWNEPGFAGWYAGHLTAGGGLTYDGLTTN